MAVIISGTDGITTPGLTNTGTETIVNLTTTGNTILGDASTDTLNVGNGGLVKDASGNVGIGTSSPAVPLHVVGNARVIGDIQSSGNPIIYSYNGASAGTVNAGIQLVGSDPSIRFSISNAEKMRFDTNGNLLLNTTAPQWTSSGSAITLAGTSGAYTRQTQSVFVGRYSSSAGLPQYTGNWASGSYWGIGPDSGTNDSTIRIGVTAGDANGAYWTGYAAVKGGAYTNASDYRLKKNVETVAGDVLSLIAQARPVSYNMIQKDEDGNDVETRKEIGFIAHELQALFPEFVTGEKDQVNGAGEVQAQGVDYAKFTAILVKAIQEQQALITTLTDRITALENK